jgi:soluble lytic murein transglycosylase-like protein
MFLYRLLLCLLLSVSFNFSKISQGKEKIIKKDIYYNVVEKQYKWMNPYYYNLVKKYSKKKKVDKFLIFSLLHAESDGNPNAISKSSARGLMQIMMGTAKFFNITNPKDLFIPEINVKIGVSHFAWLLKKNKGNIWEAAQDYNAGTGNNYYNKPYLKKILRNYKKSKKMLNQIYCMR